MKDCKGRLYASVLALSILTIVSAAVIACSSTTTATTAGSGMATANVRLSDPATCAAPNGQFSHVWVTITDVQANVNSTASSSGSGWVDLTPNLSSAPKQVDLLGQADNQCFLASLGDNLQLQAGSYQQIRLILASNAASKQV